MIFIYLLIVKMNTKVRKYNTNCITIPYTCGEND